MKKTVKRAPKKTNAPKACAFCEAGKAPEFSDAKTLEKYITERGKIIGRVRSGLCGKHQRGVTLAIKQARHLALLPFTARIS